MKKTIIWIVIILVVVGLGVWASKSKNPNSVSAEVIKIGQMSGQSGLGAEIGAEEKNGALLAVEEVNAQGGVGGKKIEMVSEDAPGLDLKRGAAAAKKLIAVDNVVAIVGPQWDGNGEVVAAISSADKTPVVSPNVSTYIESKVNSPYFFVTWPKNEVGIRELLKFAQNKGWKKIAIVQPANFSFWLFTANLVEKNAPEFGITVVAKEMGTDYAVTDYRTLISKAKAKSPDAFFGAFAELECVFLAQSKELGAPLPLLSTESAGTPKALSECPELMQNRLYFATPSQSHGYDQFEKAYEARFNLKPLSPSAVTSYNAVLVLAEVMKGLVESGQEINRENVRSGLEKVRFEGSVSIPLIEFDDKGFVETPVEAFEMKTVREGKFVKAE